MPSLDEALHTFLLIERRPATHRLYEITLSRMAAAVGPARDVSRITYEDLIDFQATLRQSLKPASVFTYTSILKAFFNWVVRRGYMARSPAADLVARKPTSAAKSKAVPPDELARMVKYAEATSPRNHAILLFLIDTACRVGGLCSLTLDNLDLDHYVAKLVEKGGREKRVRFYTDTAMALTDWLEFRPKGLSHAYVFTADAPTYGPLQVKAVQSMINRLAMKVGASHAWGPHSIRHAVGHAYAGAGAPPTVTRDKMGHSNVMTTLAYYYPQDEAYLEMMSQRYALAPLRPLDELKNGGKKRDAG